MISTMTCLIAIRSTTRAWSSIASVHYDQDYDNAFWNGDQMVFGDGDGVIFTGFTKALDVIGHELTHGVTQFTANLDYNAQSGALNESFSDVFGSLVKQYRNGEDTASADWLIGKGILAPGIHGVALRSMKAPGTAYDDPKLGGKDPQPADMSGYVDTADDNGGVHLNSGIPNHAFFLLADQLGGNAWDDAGPYLVRDAHAPSLDGPVPGLCERLEQCGGRTLRDQQHAAASSCHGMVRGWNPRCA